MVSWTQMSHPPNGFLIGSAVFAHFIRMPNTQSHSQTDTQTTLSATSVARGRIYVLRAGDAA